VTTPEEDPDQLELDDPDVRNASLRLQELMDAIHEQIEDDNR
jgi:hypothetical protein